jgi:hypothetical protein
MILIFYNTIIKESAGFYSIVKARVKDNLGLINTEDICRMYSSVY